MKYIALATVCAAAVAGAFVSYPDEFKHYSGVAKSAAIWAWDGIQANPVPAGLAVGTFLLTVVYHKAKGKSLRESVEVAATRVAVVPISVDGENPVVKRAKARATRAQLLTDLNGLQNRQRKLPEEVLKAEKDACYSEQALAEAEKKVAEKQRSHEQAVAKLEALRKEKAEGDAELAEIEGELKRLAEMV